MMDGLADLNLPRQSTSKVIHVVYLNRRAEAYWDPMGGRRCRKRVGSSKISIEAQNSSKMGRERISLSTMT